MSEKIWRGPAGIVQAGRNLIEAEAAITSQDSARPVASRVQSISELIAERDRLKSESHSLRGVVCIARGWRDAMVRGDAEEYERCRALLFDILGVLDEIEAVREGSE